MAFLDNRVLLAAPFDPARALRLPVGMVSPLWPMFSSAAAVGMVWWWSTHWMRTGLALRNLESLEATGATLAMAAGSAELVKQLPEPLAAVVEATMEPALEAIADGAPALTAEAAGSVEAPETVGVSDVPAIAEPDPELAPKPIKPRAPSPPRAIN